jgi:hypothetical protein
MAPEVTMRILLVLLTLALIMLVPSVQSQQPPPPPAAAPMPIPGQPVAPGPLPVPGQPVAPAPAMIPAPIAMPTTPARVMGSTGGCAENPVYVPLGPNSYGVVFEKVFDVISEYFEIAYANRYDGRIESFPRVAPGLGQPWKPGSPDLYQRLLASFQSIRHRAFVLIQVADDGGYFVQVVVFRELEDLPKPTEIMASNAAFRSQDTVERQFEVIDPAVYDSHWAPIGRDPAMEHAIIEKIKKCM